MNRRQLLQASALAIPGLTLPARSLFAEKVAPPPPTPGGFSKAVATNWQTNVQATGGALLSGTATSSLIGSLSSSHSTMLSELTNTNWIANINAAITANASAIENYDINNYPISSVLSSTQGYVPVITQSALETAINAWQSSQAAGMISNGVAPSIQQLVSCLQALENEAGSGEVNFMSPRGRRGAHLQTADYTGGAHLLPVLKYGPLAGFAGAICAFAAAIVAPEVILVIGAYELTTVALLGGMAGVFGIVSSVDEMNDW